jgi:hypothetical protein
VPKNTGALVLRAIENKVPPATRPNSFSEETTSLWDLFESCWALEPASRPDVESVMKSHKDWHNAFSSTATHAAERSPDISALDSWETKVSSEGTRSSLDDADPLFPAGYALLYLLIAAPIECRQIQSQCCPGYTAEGS